MKCHRTQDEELAGQKMELLYGEADAGVIAPVAGDPVGLAIAVDGNPWYGFLDPRAAGALAVLGVVALARYLDRGL